MAMTLQPDEDLEPTADSPRFSFLRILRIFAANTLPAPPLIGRARAAALPKYRAWK